MSSARLVTDSPADSGMTMIDCVAGNQRFDAPSSMRRAGFVQRSDSNALRCGWRPRQYGSLPRPEVP